MIGILDYDFLGGGTLPSLEAMKTTTYHRGREERVELITDASKIAIFEDIYLFCNGGRRDWPSLLLMDNRVQGYGSLLHGDKYKPLPLEIERSKPMPDIYLAEVTSRLIKHKISRNRANLIMRGNWNRLTAGGIPIDKNWKNIFLGRTGDIVLVDDPLFFHGADWRDTLDRLVTEDKRIWFAEGQLMPSIDVLEEVVSKNIGRREPAPLGLEKFYVEMQPNEVTPAVLEQMNALKWSAFSMCLKAPRWAEEDPIKNRNFHLINAIKFYDFVCRGLSNGQRKINVTVPRKQQLNMDRTALSTMQTISAYTTHHRNSNESLYEFAKRTNTVAEEGLKIAQSTFGGNVSELIKTPITKFKWRGWRGI